MTTENMVATDRGPISGPVEGGKAAVRVPTGALPFGVDVQVTTAGRSEVEAGLPGVGYAGHRAVTTVGVHVRNADGSKYSRPFDQPVVVVVTGEGDPAGPVRTSAELGHIGGQDDR